MPSTLSKLPIRSKKAIALVGIVLSIAVAYVLVLFQFVSLRNDQVNYFLPVRMYMSDAFNHHEFLLWNPYLSGSYPLHCDMQSPVWNPIVVVLAWLFDYNMTLLSFEFVLYYIIGAIGCFYFVQNFSKSLYACAAMAISYGCCGFAASVPEFMSWLGSFAFLPWAVSFFYQLLKRRSFYTSVRLALALWMLLVCGYPAFLIYLAYACVIILLAYFAKLYFNGIWREIIPVMKAGMVALLLLVAISLPVIHSFSEYLSYYARGKGAADVYINGESFSIAYPLSLIFPGSMFSLTDSPGFHFWYFDTYIGILPFIALCLCFKKFLPSTLSERILFFGCIFTLLFSVGSSTPVRIWAAHNLPLMNAFGFSYFARIFLILACGIWVVKALEKLFSGADDSYIKKLRMATLFFAAVVTLTLFFNYRYTSFSSKVIRYFYFGGGIWQLLLLACLFLLPKRYFKASFLFAFIVTDMIVSVNCVLPLAGLSRISPQVYNKYAQKFYASDPERYLLHPEEKKQDISYLDVTTSVNAIKQIPRFNFPSNTRSEDYFNYLADSNHYNRLAALPFAFAADSTPISLSKIDLGYNYIDIDVLASDSCSLIIQQTYYTRWQSRQPNTKLSAYDGVLLQASLQKGLNKVRLSYYHTDLLIESILSLACLVYMGIALVKGYKSRKSTKPSF